MPAELNSRNQQRTESYRDLHKELFCSFCKIARLSKSPLCWLATLKFKRAPSAGSIQAVGTGIL
jgi:hypothetical protein